MRLRSRSPSRLSYLTVRLVPIVCSTDHVRMVRLSSVIRFDSDPDQGHGALCRHLIPDDRVLPLWAEFKHMLVEAAPNLKA